MLFSQRANRGVLPHTHDIHGRRAMHNVIHRICAVLLTCHWTLTLIP
jgi:hypothetical protein